MTDLSFMCLITFVWCSVLTTTWAQSCLTGRMTDVQNWVDSDGHLTASSDSSQTLDISNSLNAVSTLQTELQKGPRVRQEIRYLSMARCQLQVVPGVFNLFDGNGLELADTLEYMTLYGNQFDDHQSTGDRYDSFLNATQARALANGVGYDTRATASWPGGFMGVRFKNLKQLDLRACAITTLSGSIFQGMENLEALYLSENSIMFVNAKAFCGLINLVHLDLSQNYEFDEFGNYKTLVLESIDVFQDLENLVSLDLSFTKLSQNNLMMFKHFGKEFQRLSLCETGLTKLRDSFFSETSLKYLDISGNSGILNHVNALAGIEDTLEVLYAERISLENFDIFERFNNLEILKLSKNEISLVKPKVARTLSNLKVLDLDINRINTWFQPTFSNMKNLEYLSLKNNNINIVNEEMLEDFETLKYLGLSNNFMICSCQTRELFEVALLNEIENTNQTALKTVFVNNGSIFSSFNTGFKEYNEVISKRKNVSDSCAVDNYCDGKIYDLGGVGAFLLLDYDSIPYQCMHVMEGKPVSFSKVSNCNSTKRDMNYGDVIQSNRRKLLSLIVLACVLFPMIIFAYIFRRNFKYFFITIRNSALLSMINKNKVMIDESRIFNYDVFVSYCNEDRSWILDHLLPHLETDCRVSVCLHERDFQVFNCFLVCLDQFLQITQSAIRRAKIWNMQRR